MRHSVYRFTPYIICHAPHATHYALYYTLHGLYTSLTSFWSMPPEHSRRGHHDDGPDHGALQAHEVEELPVVVQGGHRGEPRQGARALVAARRSGLRDFHLGARPRAMDVLEASSGCAKSERRVKCGITNGIGTPDPNPRNLGNWCL